MNPATVATTGVVPLPAYAAAPTERQGGHATRILTNRQPQMGWDSDGNKGNKTILLMQYSTDTRGLKGHHVTPSGRNGKRPRLAGASIAQAQCQPTFIDLSCSPPCSHVLSFCSS